jgi:EAL and modified HD-GYP domain-containing signal transduction protein
LSGKTIAPSEMVILNLLARIAAEASADEIARAIKHDALTSLNVLRLVNRPMAGAKGHIDSIEHALAVLGRIQLQRWLQILLYAKSDGAAELSSPLLQLASTRGKLVELMMQARQPGLPASAETGFTVGIMSLADALFSMPMERIVENVTVAPEVRAALLWREGELGQMLSVVELLESPRSTAQLDRLLKALGLSVRQMGEIELAAFRWVNELVA